MCGIAGLVALDASPARAEALANAMASRMIHRGPDGGGTLAHEDATLTMRRLAIVDVVHGQQPMASDDGSVVLVYNGEIYNAPALRRDLERRGVPFRTRSDTEVILRLYERDPERVEEELAGMWAFVIHDRRRRKVVLSRDRFGIKPLFIADAGRGRALAFASELRCFDRDLPPFQGCFAINRAAAHAMLTWSFVPEARTIYTGVSRLPPATRMEIDLASGTRTTRAYWELVPSPEARKLKTLDEASRAVEYALRRTVKEHLESDVPIATFLSGGIDSSLVTALAHEESGGRVKAYAIGFEEKRYDESPFARETAAKIGVPCEVRMFDEATARDKLADVLLAYDEPFGDSSSLATYLVCDHIAKDYKVALGGDGGDEVFAGYMKYQVVRLRRPFALAPRARDLLAKGLARAPMFRLPKRLARGLDGGDAAVYAELTQVFPLAMTAPLLRGAPSAHEYLDAAEERFARAKGTELQRQLACDLGNTLANDMLVKVDRASMARSLEARVPFLDHRVVELGTGLREEFLLGGGGKKVLRAIHERRFGPALARREKMGFGVPVRRWLEGPFDAACTRLFARKRLDRLGLLSSDALSNGKHRAWARETPALLWHAFALAAWSEATLGEGPDALREILA